MIATSSSEKASYSQSDDVTSIATTNVVQQTDTDGDESQAMTGTGDDDAQSAVTGYTTEVESSNYMNTVFVIPALLLYNFLTLSF